MNRIAVESDVYQYLIKKVTDSGLSISAILREDLGIGRQPDTQRKVSSTDFDALFESTEFRYAKGVVGRFLTVLAWLYDKHERQFGLVEKIKGRGRLYFAKGPAPLKAAGNSVNPKQIPDSPFWVITTTPTLLKQEMLANVMIALGRTHGEIQRAQVAIAGE